MGGVEPPNPPSGYATGSNTNKLNTRKALGGVHVPQTKKIGQNLKIGQLWCPVALQPYIVQNSWADCGNSLALGLQHGVNSISLQCILWPVDYSEWDPCLTDFRFQIFRFWHLDYVDLDCAQKLISLSCPDTCRHAKFHPNPCTRFWVILQTERQTKKY